MNEENTYHPFNEEPKFILPKEAEGNPFGLPGDYFSTLEKKISQRAMQQEGFQLPNKYFEQLQDRIRYNIFISELNKEHSTEWQVPRNYFETLSSRIISHINVQEKQETAVVKKLIPHSSKYTWIKYIAAACILSVVGFYGYRSLNQEINHLNQAAYKIKLAEVSNDEIISYFEYYTPSEEELINYNVSNAALKQDDFSKEELNNYLNDAF